MTDLEQKEVFGKNLSRLVELSGHTRKEVAEALGFNYKTFNGWCNGISIPTSGKLQLMADYFRVGKSRLLDPWKSDSQDIEDDTTEWYLDPETAEIAKEIRQNPDLRFLFDSARKAKPESLEVLKATLEALRRKEQYEE